MFTFKIQDNYWSAISIKYVENMLHIVNLSSRMLKQEVKA